MNDIRAVEIETFEPPVEYNEDNVVYWHKESKELRTASKSGDKKAGTLLTKAKEFLFNDCIKQENGTTWLCLPIPDYNKSTYNIRLTSEGWDCNCQGFNKKQSDFKDGNSNIKPICSHILAVKQFMFIENDGEFND